jgi:nitrite transporter NirC
MIKKSIFGGLSIAIASYIYLQVGGILGAFLFSIGLLLILNMGFKLFTGTVGYIKSKEDFKDNMIILLGNIIGACGSLAFPIASASSLITTKLSTPLLIVLLKGIVCGIFIYSAVACFRKNKDYMVPVCVVGFITFGAEHCIADLCYALYARFFSLDIVIFLLVVTLGNAIGALIVDRV